MSLKLIVIYAAFGDALLLETPDQSSKYWLIDGGPVHPHPVINRHDYMIPFNAYYQYLKRALYRYCSSQRNGVIDKLSGIIVTHPDGDHMEGIDRLLRNDITIPANFKGPVLLNSTFYKPGGPPFDYSVTQFLHDNRFGLEYVPDPFAVPQPDTDMPTNMKNGSLADLYKMIYGKPRIPYPQPVVPTWKKDDLDRSLQNWSSIITLWLDPGIGPGKAKLDLVTTGDGLPSYILERMELAIPWDPTPAVGIFKVPHHGSEYNNQWAANEEDYLGSGDIDKERKFFFFLTMLALQYSQLALIPPSSPRANIDTMNLFTIGIIRGTPMLDWTVENDAGPAEFETTIQQVSDFFRAEQERFGKTAKVNDKSFNLRRPLELRDFADALVVRYNDRKAQIIDTGHVADGTLGGSIVTVTFDKDGFKDRSLKIFGANVRNNPKYFESVFNCLNSNALDDLRKARLVQNFYARFTANNYVISGNRYPHGHPKPSVVAGLMAHLILTVQGNPRRIFVTDGASIQLDYIYDLLISLLSRSAANPLPPQQWSQKVLVYYLSTDFLAEIPVDLSPVNGVRLIDFSDYAKREDQDYLTFLNNQFMKAKPYDVPRAAISHTSMFRIAIYSLQDAVARYIDMDATGRLFLAQGNQPLFYLRPIDYSANYIRNRTYGTEPHFDLFTDVAFAQNKYIPDIVFRRPNNNLSDSDVYQDQDNTIGQLMRLHLDNSVISFKPAAVGGNTLATFKFEREP